jgi:tRNA-Thr(GGU) m(6)t(6)A37 methyltransferase TsaA
VVPAERPSSRRGRIIGGVDVNQPRFEVTPIGRVESPLTDPASAPKQGDEGAPDAWLAFEPGVLKALDGIRVGDEVIVLTWLDRARRDVLRVHPRGDVSRAQQGVFSTRSPHRPNPIGLHRVEIASIDGARVRVRNLEALDRTPIVDVKPVLSSDVSER